MAHSLRYEFDQKFNFPAQEVFKWCTDYEAGDLGLMGDEGKRSIEKISKDAIILNDAYYIGKKIVRRKKIVNLYPDTLSWVSTHLIGDRKYSQFLYRISAEGNSKSSLHFTGLQIEYDDRKNKSASSVSKRLQKNDSHAWQLLAKEMEKDMKVHAQK